MRRALLAFAAFALVGLPAVAADATAQAAPPDCILVDPSTIPPTIIFVEPDVVGCAVIAIEQFVDGMVYCVTHPVVCIS